MGCQNVASDHVKNSGKVISSNEARKKYQWMKFGATERG